MKTLSLLRHATAAPGDDDQNRPLSENGKKEAAAIAAQLAACHRIPGLILVSPARRTQGTAQAVAALSPAIPQDSDEMLYLAEADTLLDMLTLCDDAVDHVMLVGHNPGLAQLAVDLAGTDAAQIGAFAPATLAMFSCDCSWADLHPRHLRLLQVLRP